MKILIVSEMSVPHATGGGETRYGLLARELSALGHEVTWLSMKQRASPALECIDGVRHIHGGPRVTEPPLRSLLAKLRFMGTVMLHLLRWRYDVVDCQTYAPLPAAWLVCALRGQPLVATIHDTSSPPDAGRADQWLSAFDQAVASRIEKWLYRLPYDRVLTVSGAVRDTLCGRMGVPAARVQVVPNAIDVDRIGAVPAHRDEADLVFVGRLVPHKHPEVFLQVLAALKVQRAANGHSAPRAKLIGAGPLQAQTRELARALGLEDSLQWVGELTEHDEVMAHVKASRVLVLPSTREGFGLVLAEAMAGGTAVAGYRLPPVMETVGPMLGDAFVDAGDVPALTAAVARLLDDPALHARQVAHGHARARDRFGASRFAQEVLEVYGQSTR